MTASLNNELKSFLDELFGVDGKNLSSIRKKYEEALEKKSKLQEQLSTIQVEVPTKIKAALKSANDYLDKVEELQMAQKSIDSEVSDCISKGAFGVERFQQSIKKVNELERYMSYIKWITKIEDTSGEVQQSIMSDTMEDACAAFKKLIEFYLLMGKNNTACENLVSFLTKTILFWYKILKDKFTEELNEVLKQISWPFVTAPGPNVLVKNRISSDKQTPSPYTQRDPASQLECSISYLLHIHLPLGFKPAMSTENKSSAKSNTSEEQKEQDESVIDGGERDVLLLPFQVLLRPLKKRFRFHFTGNKETNVLHKPEWYLTQVINWINHHVGFLENTVQPILDKNDYAHVDALMVFTQGLLQLVTTKLSIDIEEIMYNDDLFSHTVDEVLLFDRELRISYDIPDSLLKANGPLTVLIRPDCIKKWLNIERICAEERLDTLLSSDNAWRTQITSEGADEADEMKTPDSAEAFITMLLTITDRYKHLPAHEEQLQFLDLQLLLLDDFRIRMTQVMRSVSSEQGDDVSIAILNAAFYITTVLKEWADNVFFLELKYHRDQTEEQPSHNPVLPDSLLQLGDKMSTGFSVGESRTADETVFQSLVNLYDRIYLEGLENITQLILVEFKAKSQPYLRDQWIALPSVEEQVVLVVSRSACPMLEVLQERLHCFEQKLSRTLFTKLWRCIADSVDIFLFEEVVLENHFNAGGAVQLQFDMTRNLFPLFGPYTNKPENYFKRLKEACQLLNLQTGNALLLLEAITESSRQDDPYDRVVPSTDPTKILDEIGVSLFSVEHVYKILKKRIDYLN